MSKKGKNNDSEEMKIIKNRKKWKINIAFLR